MLTYAQLGYNFCFYRIAQKLCLSPLDLNVERGNFTYTRKRSYLVWKVQYFLALAYALFISLRLCQVLFQKDQLNMIHISLHVAMALMGLLYFRLGLLFMCNKETHILICNQLLVSFQKSTGDGGHKGSFSSFIRGKSYCCISVFWLVSIGKRKVTSLANGFQT